MTAMRRIELCIGRHDGVSISEIVAITHCAESTVRYSVDALCKAGRVVALDRPGGARLWTLLKADKPPQPSTATLGASFREESDSGSDGKPLLRNGFDLKNQVQDSTNSSRVPARSGPTPPASPSSDLAKWRPSGHIGMNGLRMWIDPDGFMVSQRNMSPTLKYALGIRDEDDEAAARRRADQLADLKARRDLE